MLEALRRVAPVVAVRGNNDRGEWAEALPEYEATQFGETFIYVLHDLKELDIAPAAAGFRVVVSGHSHQPLAEKKTPPPTPRSKRASPIAVSAA